MTITLTREEAQQVLDAVSLAMSSHDVMLASDPPQDAWKARGVQTRLAGAWATLRTRLAQPEPEPVAWYYAGSDIEWHSIALNADLDDAQKANCTPLYTAPPQREWQGLTDEERYLGDARSDQEIEYAKTIEAKLKEKNS